MAKRTTITDIAKLAGVSTATVSHFLNGRFEKMAAPTRERIARTIEQTGYVPDARAQNLAARRTGVIAVLILDNTNSWAGQLFTGVEDTAREHGYQTVVCDTGFDPKVERMYVEKMLSLGVDGFLVQPTELARSVRERIEKADRPVVFYDYGSFDPRGTWVKTDLYDAFYTAVSDCLSAGYEDVISIEAELGTARTRAERSQAISAAAEARGIGHQTIRISHDAPTVTELGRAIERAASPSRRTLVVCPHQWALARVYEAMRPMAHLMPARLGLVGLSNDDWARLVEPPITTIAEPMAAEGRLACEMLLDLLGEDIPGPRHEILPCTTNWRATTLPPVE